ncbi:MAG: hypothetical protein J7L53_08580 [Deltaproteobacteria bacterium]|nr:hypothetical protein [Deltaproteobacteria bacterium]
MSCIHFYSISQESPLDQIPLYVKAGVFLPLGEVVQYVPDALPRKLKLLAFPDNEGGLEYSLCDEKGSIRFQGNLEANTLGVEVSYMPEDRDKLDVEVQLPQGYESVQIEIIHNATV